MRYVDKLINAWFMKDRDGNTIFYPYGILGCGYRISELEESEVKKFLATCGRIFLPLFILFVVFLKSWILWVLLIISLPWYHIRTRQLLMRASRVKGVSFQERAKRLALAYGLRTNFLLLGMSILMTGGAIFCLFLPDTEAKITGILGTAFFGACLWLSVVSVKYSWRARRGMR